MLLRDGDRGRNESQEDEPKGRHAEIIQWAPLNNERLPASLHSGYLPQKVKNILDKPTLTATQIFNMNFGFFGIQFGWGLQMANMSAIYEYLGARADQIPILWLAAPLTGLIVQPIIGHASDHTWTRLGRRRPYFLTGAILSSFALIMIPRSAALWMAAGLLWILDASINIS